LLVHLLLLFGYVAIGISGNASCVAIVTFVVVEMLLELKKVLRHTITVTLGKYSDRLVNVL
jgi:hypothetical protein